MIRRLRSRIHQDRDLLKALLWATAVLFLVTVFAVLGGEVVEGDTQAFDVHLLATAKALRASQPWMSGVMRDLSALGSSTVLTVVTAAAVGYLALVAARSRAWLLAASTLTGAALVSVLKWRYARPRPAPEYADFVAGGLSFPSGHATSSAVVYLSLGVLLASTRTRLSERAYILAAAAALAALVGISRIALGVHWATDVIGGWAIGAAWAMAWLLIARATARRCGTLSATARPGAPDR